MSDESGPPPSGQEPGPPPGPVFNPQTGYPVPEPSAPPAYPTPGQVPGQAPANPYGAAPPPPVQPGGYAQQGAQPYPVYVLPDLPKATAAMVVGIIAVAGTFTCGLPILASPVAWILGVQARRQIRQAPQQWGGEGKATAGMVLGIIGTVLLVLAIIVVVVVIVIAVNDPTTFDSDTSV